LAVDATPETFTLLHNFDGLLHEGRSWTDPTNSFTITVLESNGTGALIKIYHPENNSNNPPVIDELYANIEQGYKGYWYVNATVNATDSDGDQLGIFWNTYISTNFGSGRSYTESTAFDDISFGQNITTSFEAAFPVRLQVWVSDGRGGLSIGHIELFNYSAQAPIINNVSAEKVSGNGLAYIQFTVNVTETDAATYLWEFGDGTTSIHRNARHNYAENRDYMVNLTIFDGLDSTTWSETINMGYPYNTPPVVVMPENFSVAANTSFELNASLTYDPDNWPNPSLLISWNPSEDESGNLIILNNGNLTVTVIGLPPGEYEFGIRVYDGGHIVMASVWVTII
jgi:PKD repeat protein